MRVLIDTNNLLRCIPRKSTYRWLWDLFLSEKITLCVSTDILEEYAEIIIGRTTPEIGQNILRTIVDAENIVRVEPTYFWRLIYTDHDDDKFVDCAVACNADYIITEDKHFKVLSKVDFPKVIAISIDEFKVIINP